MVRQPTLTATHTLHLGYKRKPRKAAFCQGSGGQTGLAVSTRISSTRYFFHSASAAASSAVAIPASTASCLHAISASVAARRAYFFLFCGSDVSSMLCRSVSHPRHAMPHIVRCRWRNSNEPGVNRTDIINDARSGEFDDCPVM